MVTLLVIIGDDQVKSKRDSSLRRPTRSQEQTRKNEIGLLRSEWRAVGTR